jgi:hypothetical protein
MKACNKANVGLCAVSVIFLTSMGILAFDGTGTEGNPISSPADIKPAGAMDVPAVSPPSRSQEARGVRAFSYTASL